MCEPAWALGHAVIVRVLSGGMVERTASEHNKPLVPNPFSDLS